MRVLIFRQIRALPRDWVGNAIHTNRSRADWIAE